MLKTNLYRSYNWTNMPATIDATTPEYQIDEVALLLKDLGIANRTDFNVSGSSTSLNTSALLENYGYSTRLATMDNKTNFAGTGGFLETLKWEIASLRPVLLTFPTHMVVADGFSVDNDGRKVHINMGWGGTADNFYFLDAPVQYDANNNFPTDAGKLDIYYNIEPCSDGDCYVNLEAWDTATITATGVSIAGTFNHAKDADVYEEVYLKGPTKIQGSRGYGNLGFFMSIIGAADGAVVFTVVDPDDQQSTQELTVGSGTETGVPMGKYFVRASLCNDAGTICYDADSNQNYTVTLTSGVLTAEEKAAVDAALDKPPVIGNAFPDLLLNTSAGTRKILIDARDENGDVVQLQITNSNPAAVTAAPLNGNILIGNILDLTPAGAAKVASRITVIATAKGKTAEKSFIVMTDSGDTAFGKAFTVEGVFASRSDLRSHQVVLDGACTITGYNGFSNQAFYSSVWGIAGNSIVAAGDNPISSSFSRAVHLLKASLEQNPGGAGSYYSYTAGVSDRYTLTVSCPAADESTATIATLLGISLTGSVAPGDVDGDGSVTLTDAILALQILRGNSMTGTTIRPGADVDGDLKIGMAETLFILQRLSGLRSP